MFPSLFSHRIKKTTFPPKNQKQSTHHTLHYSLIFIFKTKIPQIKHSSSTKFELRPKHDTTSKERGRKILIQKKKSLPKPHGKCRIHWWEKREEKRNSHTASHDSVGFGEIERGNPKQNAWIGRKGKCNSANPNSDAKRENNVVWCVRTRGILSQKS